MVFAPAPQLTVTIERRGEGQEIHLHPGGQGVWQARMIAALGVPVVLCAAFGGEVGRVLEPLIASEGITVRAVYGHSRNGAYVHDRRSGSRVDVAEVAGEPLSRHELDELYGRTLAEGLAADLCVLSGAAHPTVVPPDTFRRLAIDLGQNGRRVVADLSGEHLDAVLAGQPYMVRVSHEDLGVGTDIDSLMTSVCRLRAAGAKTVVVTRAQRPAVALIGDVIYEVITPSLEAADARGAGDSLTAGLAAALASGETGIEAVRCGAAAGALNVTRHGLGTGERSAVRQLRERVRLVPIGNAADQVRGASERPEIRTSTQDLAERIELP
ncbi:PfkB family carbohydrate kinase [Rugosimonospora acidiphila]|uniref:PfkB family carbohydrate kinase n=2 Tax=Rugosimonospora acidiphila TaxID=556531 RepID=A0ABP9SM63_9ACTN